MAQLKSGSTAGGEVIATRDWVTSTIIGGAPAALDTLNELAAAIGDNASYASSITTALAGKLSTTGKAADSDKLDGYHASSFWRNGVNNTWTPSTNILLPQSANSQEWSFDITRNGHSGGYWQVWDSANTTMLKVDAVTGKVSAPYGFIGDLQGNITGSAASATTAGSATTATTATNLGSDYTADDWFRATGDNNTVKFYGNSRMMVFRTDGEGGDTGHTGYAFKWTYGGDGTGATRMLLDNNGNLWTSSYGWLHSKFQAAGSYAASSHDHDSTYLKLSGGTVTGDLEVNGNTFKVGRHIDAKNGWSGGNSELFLGWYSDKLVIGNDVYGKHDLARDMPLNSISVNNPLYSWKNIAIGRNASMPTAEWGATGASTGFVVIEFPVQDYAMIHAEIAVYEYNAYNGSTVLAAGHPWNNGWYQYGSKTLGELGKQVRFAQIAGTGVYCIVLGDAATPWTYGQVQLKRIQNGNYYDNRVAGNGSFRIYQGTDEGIFSMITPDTSGSIDVNRAASADSVAWSNVSGKPTIPTNNNQLTNGAGYATEVWVGEQNYASDAAISTAIGTVTLASLGYTGATNANYITNNNQLTNGAGYLTSSNDRNYITDSRGAARAPSYYNDRYAQWDFQNVGDTGVGGDGWHALLTVSKWASFDPSHRQEQLIFSGDHLWRRTAISDANWGDNKKVWDSGNLDAFVGASVSNDTITFTKASGGTVAVTTSDANTNTWRPIDDTPVNGVTDQSISSNWAYDHVNASNPHGTTASDVGADAAGSAAAVNSRIDAEVLPAIDAKQNAGNYATFTNNIYLGDSATTANFITQLSSLGAFQDNYKAFKVAWDYAGNSNLDVGFESVELAGCVIECWGGTYKHVRLTRPTTGTGGRSIYVYNDQGGSYAPGWRQIWTSDEFSSTNVSNWNTAYGWGNHAGLYLGATAKAADSNLLDGVNSTSFLRSDANDTKSGDTTFTGKVTLETNLVITEDAPTISFLDTTSGADDFYIHVNSNNFYVLRDAAGENGVDTGWDSPHPLQLEGDTNKAYIFGNLIGTAAYASTSAFDAAGTGAAEAGGVNTRIDTEVLPAIPTNNNQLTNGAGYITGVATYNGGTGDGLVPGHTIPVAIDQNYFLNGAGSWAIPPDTNTNTTYSAGTGLTLSGTSFSVTANTYAAASHTHTPAQAGLGNLSSSGNALAGNFTATGDITAFSDIRVKENIKDLEGSLDKVTQLRGVFYNKIGSEEKSIGVIAQEIKEVLPEVVKESEDGMLSVAYGNITAVLIEAIKEQQKQIEELKAQLDGLTK